MLDPSIKLSVNEWKQIAKLRRIKGYKSMSKERLVSANSESELAKRLDNAKIKKIIEDFNELIHKKKSKRQKKKEIRKNHAEIENKKNLSASKSKEIEKIFLN